MKATLTYAIEAADEAQVEQLAKHAAATLRDQGAIVVSEVRSIEESDFTVIGSIRGRPSETWSEHVRAQNEEAARGLTTEGDDRRTVVAVLAGRHEV